MQEGVPIPDLEKGCRVALVSPSLREPGIRIAGKVGADNLVVFMNEDCGQAKTYDITLQMEGDGNVFVIGPANCSANIRMHSDRGFSYLGRKTQGRFTVVLFGPDCSAYIGDGCTSNDTTLSLMPQGSTIFIGDDGMFGFGIWIRTSDEHCLFDIATGEMLNRTENRGDVVIGKHVWLAQDVNVLYGTRIGAGSAVGLRSIVTSSVPPRSLALGTPARVIRRGITWVRHYTPTPWLMEMSKALIADVPDWEDEG